MDNYIVRIVKLPRSVRGFTIPDENGDYNIYLNDRLSDADLIKAYDHEVQHIEAGHFYDDTKTVAEKEEEVHGHPKETKERTLESTSLSGKARRQEYIWQRDS